MSAAAMMACKRSCGVCVRCASNTQHALSPWKAGLSSVERGWMVPTPAWRLECRDEFAHVQFAMFAKCTNDELAAAAGGRRPEAIAAEFSFVHVGLPLFTPHPYL